jgi:hypothetical protein
MKKTIAVFSLIAILGATAPTASAGDGWSTTGKVLTGLLAFDVVAHAFAPPPVYYPPVAYGPPVYSAPLIYTAPPVYAAPVARPAPVYYAPYYPACYGRSVYIGAPFVRVGFGFGHGFRPHHFHR